ncbi:MAG: hypothetical protein NC302_11060 [Bacteroidales bacterium]|nr:hypothetical protein [Bacteroidales bacterium]MCM1415279.1 hypothetical protein [bacterium]MCM1424445.1 hypothetical protein [bacterium]
MAGIVNLQQSEYDTAIAQMEALHQTAVDGIVKIADQIQALSETAGGFYIEKISEKTSMLLNTLHTGVCMPMQTNMENTLESMNSFAQIIDNLDSACNM